MKKIVFMLIAALSVALTACSAFDSMPIEPKIIGTGNLQYEAKSSTYFVVVDSTQYTIVGVTVSGYNPPSFRTTQDIAPVEGMLVTLFTSQRMKGVHAVTGKQTVEQIEKLYRTNDTVRVFVFGFCALFFLAYALREIKSLYNEC